MAPHISVSVFFFDYIFHKLDAFQRFFTNNPTSLTIRGQVVSIKTPLPGYHITLPEMINEAKLDAFNIILNNKNDILVKHAKSFLEEFHDKL